MVPTHVVALLLGASLSAGAPTPPEPEELERMWARFQNDFARNYQPDRVERLRFRAFKRNVLRAWAMNLEQGTACSDLFDDKDCVFGVTKFMDLFPDEFAAARLGYKRIRAERANASVISREELPAGPSEIDWRTKGAVTQVKDQGDCGSCWAFSTTSEVESQAFMTSHKLPVLSTQQVVACDKVDQGCEGGDTVSAYQYLEKAGGLDTASDYPDTSSQSGHTGPCKWDKREVVKVTGFTYATKPCDSGRCNHQDEGALAQALAAKGPISICVNAGDWQVYNRGIYSRKCSAAASDLDHCVQLVGYNKASSRPYWIVRNSWNTDWGVDGYMYLAMGKNLCGIANEATIVEVSAGNESIVV